MGRGRGSIFHKGAQKSKIKRSLRGLRSPEKKEEKALKKAGKKSISIAIESSKDFLDKNESKGRSWAAAELQKLALLDQVNPEQLGEMMALTITAFPSYEEPVRFLGIGEEPDMTIPLLITDQLYDQKSDGNYEITGYKFQTLFDQLHSIGESDVKNLNKNISSGEDYSLGFGKSMTVKEFNQAGGIPSGGDLDLYRQPELGSKIKVDLNALRSELQNWDDSVLLDRLKWTKEATGDSTVEMEVTGYGQQGSMGPVPMREEDNSKMYPFLRDQNGSAVVDDSFTLRLNSDFLGELPNIPMWATGRGTVNPIVSKLELGDALDKNSKQS